MKQNTIPHTHIRYFAKDESAPKTHHAAFFFDTAQQLLGQPNALRRGHYVLGVSAFSTNAGTARALVDLLFPGEFAIVTDRLERNDLGGVRIAIVMI